MFLNDDKEFVRITYDFFVNADKRTYAAIGIALFVAFLYFGAFFRNASGFKDDVDKATDVPVLDKDYDPVESQWSDNKISIWLLISVVTGVLSYYKLPDWFPTIFGK
jgi:uncharacterized membrane protein